MKSLSIFNFYNIYFVVSIMVVNFGNEGEVKGDYAPFYIDISFALVEGDVSYKPDANGVFGKSPVWDFANELANGDYVELIDSEAKTVKKATGLKPLIGKLISNPEWDNAASRPLENKADGEYVRRRATVRLYGTIIETVELTEQNAEIKPGDGVAITSDGKWDKSTKSIRAIALTGKEALKSGRVQVLFGYYGNFEK